LVNLDKIFKLAKNIELECKKLTTGNVSHKKGTIAQYSVIMQETIKEMKGAN